MFVSGFNINLQVAVSIQLYKELCNNNNNNKNNNNNNNKVFWVHLKKLNRASNNSHEKYTVQVYQLELDKKSLLHDKHQNYV